MTEEWRVDAENLLSKAVKKVEAATNWTDANNWLNVIKILTPLVLDGSRFKNMQREIIGALSGDTED